MHKFLKCIEHAPSLHVPTAFEKAALILESDSSSLEATSGNHLVQLSVESRWLSYLSCQTSKRIPASSFPHNIYF